MMSGETREEGKTNQRPLAACMAACASRLVSSLHFPILYRICSPLLPLSLSPAALLLAVVSVCVSGPSEPNLAFKLAGRWYGLGADNESRAAKPQPLQNGRRGLGTEGEEEEEREEKWGKEGKRQDRCKAVSKKRKMEKKGEGERANASSSSSSSKRSGSGRRECSRKQLSSIETKARGATERQTDKPSKARKPDNYNVRVALIGSAMLQPRNLQTRREIQIFIRLRDFSHMY
ncbi:hypothetical protein WR25_01090 [Diploscapter pachys]|uniref:Uncharacterized protein n=1 Tax=Diploscapter pachys TaxID=2018661 RepID=A0A2A2J2Z5_9BILA|nr:hypothetical protein WR25_01090 [Diploscapter pachys]